MPEIVAADVTHAGTKRLRSRSSTPQYTRLNDRMAQLLCVIVLLTAVPLASNRPVWPLIWGLVFGSIALYYLLRGRSLAPTRPLQVEQFRRLFAVALIVPVFAVLQALPIASLLPGSWLQLPIGIAELAPRTPSVLSGASFLGALRAMGYLLVVILFIEVATRQERVSKMAMILFFGIALHAAYALVALNLLGDFVFWGEKREYLGFATGTFVNRNSFATFLGFGLVLGVAVLFARAEAPQIRSSRHPGPFSPQNLETYFFWLTMAVIALALFATQSRMGIAASAIGVLVTFALLRARSGVATSRVFGEVLLGLAVLVTIGFATVGRGALERSVFAESDSAVRIEIYRQALGMIMDRPLMGFGYDAFAAGFELFRAAPLLSNEDVDLAHNSYLTLWVEQGLIVGSIPPVLLLVSLGYMLQNLWSDRGNGIMAAAGIGVLMLGAVHSLADFSLEIPANVFLFLAVIGMAMSRRLTSSPDRTE